jgi:hypothetical protein
MPEQNIENTLLSFAVEKNKGNLLLKGKRVEQKKRLDTVYRNGKCEKKYIVKNGKKKAKKVHPFGNKML